MVWYVMCMYDGKGGGVLRVCFAVLYILIGMKGRDTKWFFAVSKQAITTLILVMVQGEERIKQRLNITYKHLRLRKVCRYQYR